MNEYEKMKFLSIMGKVFGFLAFGLGFLRLNEFVPDSIVSYQEAVLGIFLGSVTLGLTFLADKFYK